MPAGVSPSRCCQRGSVEFYWAHFDGADIDDHIRHAVEMLFSVVERRGERAWNPYNATITKTAFRRRLQAAARGDLDPPGELKPLRGGRGHLYEIRWQDVQVTNFLSDRSVEHRNVLVRLIHTEPPQLPASVIALHAHEKDITGSESEIHDAQDSEIAQAEQIYYAGRDQHWDLMLR